VACMGEKCTKFWWESDHLRRWWKDEIRIDLREIGCRVYSVGSG
jgi:hypothetical protein